MSLVPNSPAKRLKWVRETYWKKDPNAVSMAYEVARHLFGLETNRVLTVYFDGAANALAADRLDEALAALIEIEKNLDNAILPRHESDFLVPWAARELVRLNAAVDKGEVTEIEREEAENLLIRKGPAIAQWAKRERKDILKVSLAEALEAVASVEIEAKGAIPQGTVVYEFPDGWTVQELAGDVESAASTGGHRVGLQDQLKAEGDIMQHCVGSYCDAVESGESRIYSLRDPKGRPHVTMEWQPSNPSDWADWDPHRFMNVHPRPTGHFVQIMGKQNEAPAAKYVPYVVEFIRKRFDSEPIGLYLAGLPAREINWKSRGPSTLKNAAVDWNHADLSGADLSGMSLRDMSFVGADFTDANLRGANGRATDFRDADFTRADVAGFDVTGGADLGGADLSNAKNIEQLDFDDTTGLKMSDEQMAETFGKMYSRERGEMREVVWDPYARGYVWADEAETYDEEEPVDDDEDEDDDEATDDSSEDQIEANPGEETAIAKRVAAVLARFMPQKLAWDIAANAAGGVGLEDESTVARSVEWTLRHRIKHPGANASGPVPPLTEKQIADILAEIDRDPANRSDFKKLRDYWRNH